jgi:hypothetical protein
LYFNLLAERSARNFEFAQAFRRLGKIILEIAAEPWRVKVLVAEVRPKAWRNQAGPA